METWGLALTWGADTFNNSIDFFVCPMAEALASFKPGLAHFDAIAMTQYRPLLIDRSVQSELLSDAAAEITANLAIIHVLILDSVVSGDGEVLCYCIKPGSQGDAAAEQASQRCHHTVPLPRSRRAVRHCELDLSPSCSAVPRSEYRACASRCNRRLATAWPVSVQSTCSQAARFLAGHIISLDKCGQLCVYPHALPAQLHAEHCRCNYGLR